MITVGRATEDSVIILLSQVSPFLGEGQSLEVPLWSQQGLTPALVHACVWLPSLLAPP